jgi:hypothetical protein
MRSRARCGIGFLRNAELLAHQAGGSRTKERQRKALASDLGRLLGDDHSFGNYFNHATDLATGVLHPTDFEDALKKTLERIHDSSAPPLREIGGYFERVLQRKRNDRAHRDNETRIAAKRAASPAPRAGVVSDLDLPEDVPF